MGDALTEAGFEPNEWQGRLDENVVLAKLADATRHFKKFPTKWELTIYKRQATGFPSPDKLISRYGSTASLRERLAEWVRSQEAYADVGAILGNQQAVPRELQPATADGFVYLIGSGGHYKIGRSDQLERRVKQIKVALPEAASLVHSIRTDDPAGIEVYWHRRFADRRANGEWFKLTAADIRAFKRRKFQ